MENQKYQLLKMRLKSPETFSSNTDIWKTGNMNKFINVHGAFLRGDEVFVLGKYRDSVDPVRLVTESELPQLWNEVHNRVDGHASRDATIERFCKAYWFYGCQSWLRQKVKDCIRCHEKEISIAQKQIAPLRPYAPEKAPWMRLHLDLTEGFYDVS